MSTKQHTSKPLSYTNITPWLRKKHCPVSGALYRCKHNANGEHDIRQGDLVMVVSEAPHLTEKSYTKKTNSGKTVTVIRVWNDLVILWNEKAIAMDGTSENTWYHWFERVYYDTGK